MMKNVVRSMALALTTALVVPAAFAQVESATSHLNEFTGGTNSNLTFGSDYTNVGAALGWYYLIAPNAGLQVGYETNYGFTSIGNADTTNWLNVFGIRYNLQFSNDITDQIFIGAGAGFVINKAGGASDTSFVYQASLGKRFTISDRVSYTPSFTYRGVSGQDARFIITPIALSVFLF